MGAQRALRSRFDDFHRALERGDRATLEVALIDFDENFRRWSLAEEQTLLPALARLALAGRDPQRELRLEYAQIREITALLRRRLAEGLRPADLAEAPPLVEVVELILEALTGRIVVAHPARVEREFLSVALRAAGVRLAEPVICTATLAGQVLADRVGARGGEVPLSDAAGALGLPVHAPHTAEGDALTTAQLFIALATRLDRREPQTVGSMARLSGA